MDQKKVAEDVVVTDKSFHKGRLKEALSELLKRRTHL